MESYGHVCKLAATAGAVVVVALAAAGCTSARHEAASAAAARPGTAHEALQVSKALPCAATVTKWHPPDGTSVGVRVRTVPGAQISVTAHYRTVSRGKSARANAAGRRTFRYWISDATPRYRVEVDVVVSQAAQKGSCATWFAPRSR